MKKSIILVIITLLAITLMVLSVATLTASSSKPATTTTTTTKPATTTSGKTVETTVQVTSGAGKPIESTQTTTTTTNAGKTVETTTQTSGVAGKTVQTTTQNQTKTQSQPLSMGVERAYPGYLTDNYSGSRGKDRDGYDLYMNPARHTLYNIRSNSASGYGVFLRTNKNNFRYYRLNTKGSRMAQDVLANTNRKENIYVVVKGSLGSDGVIYATSIKEVAHGKDKEKQMLKDREKEMNQNYNKGKDKKNNGKGNK